MADFDWALWLPYIFAALMGIAILVYVILDGFDLGIGILSPLADDTQKDRMVSAIGPFWDANETWLVLAVGLLLVAFPVAHGVILTTLYFPVAVLLIGLILRGVAFEFRSKNELPGWRAFWDWSIFGSSFVAALLWGVAMSNLIRGVPIDGSKTYVGGFFNLLHPFCLVGGLAAVALFTLHGAVFLALKTDGEIRLRARAWATKLWLPTVILVGAYVSLFVVATDVIEHVGYNPGIVPFAAVIALLLVRYYLGKEREGWAFIMTGLAVVFSTVTVFVGLFPRLMVSSLDPEWSLTIYNASSSHYTLKLMSIVAAALVPVVLIYQGWT